MNAIGRQLRDLKNYIIGTDPMAANDTAYYYLDAAAEIGRNPVSKHQIQPE